MLVWMFGKNIGHQTKGFFKEGNQHLITFGLVFIIISQTWLVFLKIAKVTKSNKPKPSIYTHFHMDFLQ
jgi:hypothetical protein